MPTSGNTVKWPEHCTENMKTWNLIPVLHVTVCINFICKPKRIGLRYPGSFPAFIVHGSILNETQDSFFAIFLLSPSGDSDDQSGFRITVRKQAFP